MALLEVEDLRIDFGGTPVVTGVSLRLEAGRTLCLVGESGCGKSVTALALARLLPPPPAAVVRGVVRIDGRDVAGLDRAGLRRLRGGSISYVFQDPAASLNPVLRVGRQIRECLAVHRPERATDAEVVRLLASVGIPSPERRALEYPHRLSGGMQQRVMIAMAIASEPRLLVADEPTTALDVTIQAQILDLLRELQERSGMGILLITHNLGLVAEMGHEVAVMYAGEIVETGPAAALLRRPRHPYTRALLESVPDLERPAERLAGIPGSVPVPGQWPAGCRFAPRCTRAISDCSHRHPDLLSVGVEDGSQVRCPLHLQP